MKLGDRISFSKILVRIYDGKYMVWDVNIDAGTAKVYDNTVSNDVPVQIIETGEEFEKTYYKEKPTKGTGYIIGVKDVAVTNYIGIDYYDNPYGKEVYYPCKRAGKTTKCYVVAYAMNKTHLVPIE